MADGLSGFSRTFRGSLALLACAVSAAAHGEALVDPTRPPEIIGASAVAAGASAVPRGDTLQSVIVSPARRAAVINGRTVELGGKYDDATLVEVSESGAVLEGAQGRKELALFPGVSIKRAVPAEKSGADVVPARRPKKTGGGAKSRKNAEEDQRELRK